MITHSVAAVLAFTDCAAGAQSLPNLQKLLEAHACCCCANLDRFAELSLCYTLLLRHSSCQICRFYFFYTRLCCTLNYCRKAVTGCQPISVSTKPVLTLIASNALWQPSKTVCHCLQASPQLNPAPLSPGTVPINVPTPGNGSVPVMVPVPGAAPPVTGPGASPAPGTSSGASPETSPVPGTSPGAVPGAPASPGTSPGGSAGAPPSPALLPLGPAGAC